MTSAMIVFVISNMRMGGLVDSLADGHWLKAGQHNKLASVFAKLITYVVQPKAGQHT